MTIRVARRALLLGLGAGLAPYGLRAQPLVVTPAQTLGPYYPVAIPADADSDLVQVAGQAARAGGTVLDLSGRVLDRSGRPVAGAVVEIWQCDAQGRYLHPRAPRTDLFDPGFQGFGRSTVDGAGAYRFRTIRPVPYTGRTPHIHFLVRSPRHGTLVTQMYVEGEPLNQRDGLWRSIRDPAQRRAVTVTIEAREGGPGRARFDIVLDA